MEEEASHRAEKEKNDYSILREQLRRYELLNAMILEMSDLEDHEKIFQFAVEKIHSIFPETIILYISINEEKFETRLEALAGLTNEQLYTISELAGTPFIGKKFKLFPGFYEKFKSGKLIEHPGGFAEFATSEIPGWMAKSIENILPVHTTYTVGVVKGSNLLGAIHLFTKNESTYFDVPIIETFAKQIGSTLQKKKADQDYRESEKKFRKTVELLGEGVGLVDAEENFIFANSSAEKIFEVLPGQLTGKNLSEFLIPEELDKIKKQTIIRKTGLVSSYDLDILTGQGIRKTIIVTSTPNFNEKNEFMGAYGVFRDITDRKKEELALIESEARFRSLFEKSNDAIFIVDKVTGRYLDANKAAEILTGRTIEEITSLTTHDISPLKADGRLKILLEMKSTIDFGEIEYIRKDGSSRIAMLTAIPIEGNKIFGISHDITDFRLAQQKILLQNAELEKLNEDKNRFISILAHDLRNPFNTLLGLSSLLMQNITIYDRDKIENQVNILHFIAKHTFNLLEELLLWTRSQSGKLPFEPSWIDFIETCEEVCPTLLPHAQNKKITIDYFSEEKISLWADKDMLRTIMRNLVSNAIKFTDNQGKIRVYAESFPGEVVITVSDTGIGMDEKTIERLFSLSQVYSTKGTRNEKGTGLGLILCKDFVEKHGGRIWVESKIGKGSDFSFSLPNRKE